MRVIPISLCVRTHSMLPSTIVERLPERSSLLALEIGAAPGTFRINRVYFAMSYVDKVHCIEVVTKFPYDASKLLVVNVKKPPDTWLAIDYVLLNLPPVWPLFDATAWVETS